MAARILSIAATAHAEEIAARDAEIARLRAEVESAQKELRYRHADIDFCVAKFKEMYGEKALEIAVQSTTSASDVECDAMEDKLEAAQAKIAQQAEEIEAKDEELDFMQSSYGCVQDLSDERRAQISALQSTLATKDAEIARLREALEPFAEEAYQFDSCVNEDGESFGKHDAVHTESLNVEHLRRAREALKERT